MARVTKKKEMTTEEKLATALVPEDEQPYPVPGNWCWAYVGAVCAFVGGGTPSKSNSEYWNGNIPWASVKDIKGDYLYNTIDHISKEGYKNSAANICRENDLILVTRIEPAKTIISKIRTSINQDLKIVKSNLPVNYLHYFFKTFQHVFESKSSGSTVKGITISNVQNTPIPIPPLAEQQRIVDIIESLFADLDAAGEKLMTILDGFVEHKASILHRAFTGELTARWRKEKCISDALEKVTIGSVCHSLKYGTAKKSDMEGKVVVLRMGNLQQGEIDWTSLAYSNDEEDNQKYKLFPGDVLFNRTNSAELVGKTSIYRGEFPAIYAGYLIKLDYDRERVIGDYLNYMLNSPEAYEYCRNVKTDGVNQSNINAKKIGAFIIPLPTIREQEEIVRILQELISSDNQAQNAVEEVLVDIENLKKSILARALRGELGTGNPDDESAMELLQRVM